MKNIIHKHTNIKKILTTIVCILIVASVGVFLFKDSLLPNNNTQQTGTSAPIEGPIEAINQDPPTEDQQKAGYQAKQDFINNQDDKSNSSASISISSVTTGSTSLNIRTIITTVDDTGTCTLTMTSPNKEAVTQTAGTQSLGSYSVCKGFNIENSLLGNSTWKIKITYKGASGQAAVEQEIKL